MCTLTCLIKSSPRSMQYELLNEKPGGRSLRDRNSQLHLLNLLHRIKEETTWDVIQAVANLEETWRGVVR